MRYFSVVIFLLFLSSETYAGFDFNTNCREAYEDIISLKFKTAKTKLDNEKKINTGNTISVFLDNYIDFFTLIIGENSNDFSALQKNKDIRLRQLEKGDSKSPWFLYSQAEVNLQWAFIHVKFGEYLAAVGEINKAYKLLEDNQNKHPNFLPNMKSMGLLHAIIGTVPDNYKWAVNIMGIDGTIKQGVKELNTVVAQSQTNSEYNYLLTESLFLLSFVELNLSKDKDNIEKLYTTLKYLPGYHPLLTFAKASIAIKTSRNNDAISFLEKRAESAEQYPFYYLDLLTGEAKLNRLDMDADVYIKKYIDNFKGASYIKTAYQKLGWFNLLVGDNNAYRKNMEYVIVKGNDISDEDKQALKEAESGEVPNLKLLKARLLFDGGYYLQALTILVKEGNAKDFTSEKDQLEFTYRLGRIYHSWGKPDDAISYYEMTIKNGAKSSYYFAANASLQLGLIYEEKKDYKKAREYFERCPSFKNKEYRNSIGQKAKAGLNRIEGK
ncbi:MAG: tol-pal system YbgF family protein [Bacteroidia bacterium]